MAKVIGQTAILSAAKSVKLGAAVVLNAIKTQTTREQSQTNHNKITINTQ